MYIYKHLLYNFRHLLDMHAYLHTTYYRVISDLFLLMPQKNNIEASLFKQRKLLHIICI